MPGQFEDGLGAVGDFREAGFLDEVVFEGFPEGVVAGLEALDDGFGDRLAVNVREFRAILCHLIVGELQLQMFEGFLKFLVVDHDYSGGEGAAS